MTARSELEPRLASAFDAARVRWPAVMIDVAAFRAHAIARYPDGVEPERWHAEELYLTCALVAGDAHAIARFDAEYLAGLDRVLARFDDPALVDETRQVLRTRLLVNGEDGSAPRIGGYTGKGALAKWIEVAALRAAISLRRIRDVPVDDRTLTALQGGDGDPQLAHLKDTYRAQFLDAWRRALRALEAGDRTLLRLHVIDRLSVDRIGALYGVHPTTAARRVRDVKERLAARVREILQDALSVSADVLASILELIRSRMEITLGELLSSDEQLRNTSPAER